MTRWQFSYGSSIQTVADGSNSVTYNISSLSIDHAGVYHCEAIIDGMTDISINYTLFGKLITLLLCNCVDISNLANCISDGQINLNKDGRVLHVGNVICRENVLLTSSI